MPRTQIILGMDGYPCLKCLSIPQMLPMQFKIRKCMSLEDIKSLLVDTDLMFRFSTHKIVCGKQCL